MAPTRSPHSAGTERNSAGAVAPVPVPVPGRAAWIDEAVVYGVVPRNFEPSGFAGVTARLDDLADLGVSALWLTPIFPSPPGDFGYAVTDYVAVRPELGGADGFRALVRAAHARGMRILLDVVPNHTSTQHPHFQDAVARGSASPSWNWYDRDDAGTPTHYFNWTHLPNLNFDHPEVRRFMLEALTYWVREFDVDGFRLDAIWGIRQRNPEWLTTLVTELHRSKPGLLLIAEASARDPFYADAGFDAAYDWTDQLGHWAWAGALDGAADMGRALTAILRESEQRSDPDGLVFRFLNNNDTGPRFITTHGVACYRVALTMLLTLPGLPCLFTGDEVGAEYQPYDTPGPIDWTDRHGLRPHLKRLIALRREMPVLHGPGWDVLAPEPAGPCLAYVRFADADAGDDAAPVLVVLNYSAASLEAVVRLPAALAASFAGRPLTDRWTGEPQPNPSGDTLRLALPGWGIRLVTYDGA